MALGPAALSVLLAACPTSFEVVVPSGPVPGEDAGVPTGGEPFECGLRPAVPYPAPEDLGAIRFIGDGTRASCTEAAVQQALDGGGYLRFRCGPGLIEITSSAPLRITQTGTVVDGEGRVTVTGAGTSRLFETTPTAAVAVLRNLALSRGSADAGGALRVTGGAQLWLDRVVLTSNAATGATAPGTPPNAGGGAVHVMAGGELIAVSANFLNNGADFGGAIWTEGRLALHAVRFRSNQASAGVRSGGAVACSGGEVVLCDSELEDNRAGLGGALFVDEGAITVSTTSFVANPALGGDPRLGSFGGAMVLRGSEARIERSTFDGNLSIQGGGAIVAIGGTSRWENVTFVDNNAASGAGGAMLFDGGTHAVVHATFVDNQAREPGSALGGSGDIEVHGTLLTGAAPLCAETYGGADVMQTGVTPCVAGASLMADLGLGAARSTCGRVDVFTPPPTSPGNGAGTPSGCPDVDQCGAQRGDGPCDLGSVEQ